MKHVTTPVKGVAVEARPGVDARPGAAAFRSDGATKRPSDEGEEGRKTQNAKAAANGALVGEELTDEKRAAVTQDWCDDFIAAAKSCRATITRSVPSWVNAHTAMRLLRAAGAQCYGTERSVTVVSVAVEEAAKGEAAKKRRSDGATKAEEETKGSSVTTSGANG